jgi:uncharacterized membrane protein YuzA (DUF378 family)
VTAAAPAVLHRDRRRFPYATQEFSMSILNKITLLLLVVGGLNWGLVGLFDFDLVAAIFGEMSLLSRLVYELVGLSALWQLVPLLGGDTDKKVVRA